MFSAFFQWSIMQCQNCEKTATFHITELAAGKPQELHLCEEHARDYLQTNDQEQAAAPSLASVLAHKMTVGQTAEDLARLDQRACPVCGITFYEFRNQGRFGCPHDYTCFAGELDQPAFEHSRRNRACREMSSAIRIGE